VRGIAAMLNDDAALDRSALVWPMELKPAETKQVAGGSPTLPLPPPDRANPDPMPW
jgi:hypothetical protein